MKQPKDVFDGKITVGVEIWTVLVLIAGMAAIAVGWFWLLAGALVLAIAVCVAWLLDYSFSVKFGPEDEI